MEKISIIVPVYNCAPFLNRCVDSILRQTYDSIELLLIDDGSTDSSGAICDKYAAKDPRAGACESLIRLPKYPLESAPACESGLLGDESIELLRAFFSKMRKKKT
jgi:glycosyltransferase involved in cell wall biosynthesis